MVKRRLKDAGLPTRLFPRWQAPLPLYLVQPGVIFKRIWADPVQDKLHNLAD